MLGGGDWRIAWTMECALLAQRREFPTGLHALGCSRLGAAGKGGSGLFFPSGRRLRKVLPTTCAAFLHTNLLSVKGGPHLVDRGPRGIQSRHWIEFQDAVQNKQDLERNLMGTLSELTQADSWHVPKETLRKFDPDSLAITPSGTTQANWQPGPQVPVHFELLRSCPGSGGCRTSRRPRLHRQWIAFQESRDRPHREIPPGGSLAFPWLPPITAFVLL
jgi:hypothetical protein